MMGSLLGRRSTVGLQILDLRIGVRIPASQPIPAIEVSRMRVLVFLFLSVVPLFSQAATTAPIGKPAPTSVDKALRARVEAMMQARLEGGFRKAYDFVASDSKDFFLQMDKPQVISFKIEAIQWSDKFKKAVVRVSTIRKTRMMGIPGDVQLPGQLEEAWKKDGGHWVWYHDPNLDRTGLFGIPVSSTQTGGPKPDGKKAPVPSDTSPAAVAAAAKSLESKVMIDKESLQFVEGQAVTQQFVYTNVNNGQIRVQAEVLFQPKGYIIEPVDVTLNPNESTTFKVHYDPAEGVLKNVNVRLYVDPFGKTYQVPVQVKPAPKQP